MKLKLLIVAVSTLALNINAASADVSVDKQDLNKDGVVTFQEVIDSHPKSIKRTQAFMDRHRKIFEGADTNGDNSVDRSESQGGSTGKTKTKDGKKS